MLIQSHTCKWTNTDVIVSPFPHHTHPYAKSPKSGTHPLRTVRNIWMVSARTFADIRREEIFKVITQ